MCDLESCASCLHSDFSQAWSLLLHQYSQCKLVSTLDIFQLSGLILFFSVLFDSPDFPPLASFNHIWYYRVDLRDSLRSKIQVQVWRSLPAHSPDQEIYERPVLSSFPSSPLCIHISSIHTLFLGSHSGRFNDHRECHFLGLFSQDQTLQTKTWQYSEYCCSHLLGHSVSNLLLFWVPRRSQVLLYQELPWVCFYRNCSFAFPLLCHNYRNHSISELRQLDIIEEAAKEVTTQKTDFHSREYFYNRDLVWKPAKEWLGCGLVTKVRATCHQCSTENKPPWDSSP